MVARSLRNGLPVLGICYDAQLLAQYQRFEAVAGAFTGVPTTIEYQPWTGSPVGLPRKGTRARAV